MALLILGILLFAIVHFIPSLAQEIKSSLIEQLGESDYKSTYVLLISLALIIFGWRSPVPAYLCTPPAALHQPALFRLAVAFWLLAVSQRASRLQLIVRHPQLTGTALWGRSHLLLNGDSRGLILFEGMTAWALCEMRAINRRDGAWIKNKVPSWSSECISLLIAATMIAITVTIHPWLSGAALQ